MLCGGGRFPRLGGQWCALVGGGGFFGASGPLAGSSPHQRSRARCRGLAAQVVRGNVVSVFSCHGKCRLYVVYSVGGVSILDLEMSQLMSRSRMI